MLAKVMPTRMVQMVALVCCIVLLPTSTAQDYPQLDKFIGRWLEVEKTGFDQVADNLRLPAHSKQVFLSSKSVVIFSRDGDLWTIESGVEGSSLKSYSFKFGEPYYSTNIDGTRLLGVVLPEGDRLVGRYTAQTKDPYVLDVIWQVNSDTMTTTTTVGEETEVTTFNRVE